jgi:hypothetical protein
MKLFEAIMLKGALYHVYPATGRVCRICTRIGADFQPVRYERDLSAEGPLKQRLKRMAGLTR